MEAGPLVERGWVSNIFSFTYLNFEPRIWIHKALCKGPKVWFLDLNQVATPTNPPLSVHSTEVYSLEHATHKARRVGGGGGYKRVLVSTIIIIFLIINNFFNKNFGINDNNNNKLRMWHFSLCLVVLIIFDTKAI